MLRPMGLPNDDEQDQFLERHRRETAQHIASLPQSPARRVLEAKFTSGRTMMTVKDSPDEDTERNRREHWETCRGPNHGFPPGGVRTLVPNHNDFFLFVRPMQPRFMRSPFGKPLVVDHPYPAAPFDPNFVAAMQRLVRETKAGLQRAGPARDAPTGVDLAKRIDEILDVGNFSPTKNF